MVESFAAMQAWTNRMRLVSVCKPSEALRPYPRGAAHEKGYGHEHIELQLARAPRNAVSAAYNHALYLERRAKMMKDWADFLEQTLCGGKLIPFRSHVA